MSVTSRLFTCETMPPSPSPTEVQPGARHLPVLPVHQVVDEELRAAIEQLRQGLGPVDGGEGVELFDRDPGQLRRCLVTRCSCAASSCSAANSSLRAACHSCSVATFIRPPLYSTPSLLKPSVLEAQNGQGERTVARLARRAQKQHRLVVPKRSCLDVVLMTVAPTVPGTIAMPYSISAENPNMPTALSPSPGTNRAGRGCRCRANRPR